MGFESCWVQRRRGRAEREKDERRRVGWAVRLAARVSDLEEHPEHDHHLIVRQRERRLLYQRQQGGRLAPLAD